jgi:hypothetical protein
MGIHIRDNQKPIADSETAVPADNRDVDSTKAYPLSYGQQALWFLHHLAAGSDGYNLVFTARLRGAVDLDVLDQAFRTLLDRHPILRVTFGMEAHGPVQIVGGGRETLLVREDVGGCSPQEVRDRIVVATRQPFDLTRGPVMRVILFARSREEYILLVAVHHIVFDARSVEIFLGELRELLAARDEGRVPRLRPLAVQYFDFVRWQADRVRGSEGRREREFWEAKLAGNLPVLRLPYERPRAGARAFRGATKSFVINADLTAQLRRLAAAEDATLYVLLLAAYALLLRHASGQEEIIIGSSVAGRPHREFVHVIGYFINMVAIRLQPAQGKTFAALLREVREEVFAALAHREYPFALIVKEVVPARDPSRTPVFQAVFNLIRAREKKSDNLSQLFITEPPECPLAFGRLTLEPYPIRQPEGHFGFVLELLESGGKLHGLFKCDAQLFEAETVQRLTERLVRLLEAIAQRPDADVAALEAVAFDRGAPGTTESEREELDL